MERAVIPVLVAGSFTTMFDLLKQNVFDYFNHLAQFFGTVRAKNGKVICRPLDLTHKSVTTIWTPQGTRKGGQSCTDKTEDAIEYLERMVQPQCLETYPNCEHHGNCWYVPLVWGSESDFKNNELKYGILDKNTTV